MATRQRRGHLADGLPRTGPLRAGALAPGPADVGLSDPGPSDLGPVSAGRAGAQPGAVLEDSVRLDAELVRRGLARSREDAVELVTSGAVTVEGQVVTRAAARVSAQAALETRRSTAAYVSRGAPKLAGALADLAQLGLTVSGRRCLDVGASAGGFTQVLFAAGAAAVVAVDVGTGQLAPALRADARVTVRDSLNARDLHVDMVGEADLIVVDVSFISLTLVLPALATCLAPGGDLLPMIKPQFEVGPGRLGSGGVVRDPAARLAAVERVAAAAALHGLGTRAVVPSRQPGAAGNVEYFLWLQPGGPAPDPAALRAAVAAGPA